MWQKCPVPRLENLFDGSRGAAAQPGLRSPFIGGGPTDAHDDARNDAHGDAHGCPRMPTDTHGCPR